jgi:hypothetical protein
MRSSRMLGKFASPRPDIREAIMELGSRGLGGVVR